MLNVNQRTTFIKKNGVAAYTHTVIYTCCLDENAIMNCFAGKGISLPLAPLYNKGRG